METMVVSVNQIISQSRLFSMLHADHVRSLISTQLQILRMEVVNAEQTISMILQSLKHVKPVLIMIDSLLFQQIYQNVFV